MTDFWTMVKATVDDPIVIALGVIVAGYFAARSLFNHSPLGRAFARVVLLVVLTVVLLRGGIVPYQPSASSGAPFRDAAVAAMKVAWWLWAAWLLVGFLHSFLVIERRPREVKLLHDLLAGLVY